MVRLGVFGMVLPESDFMVFHRVLVFFWCVPMVWSLVCQRLDR